MVVIPARRLLHFTMLRLTTPFIVLRKSVDVFRSTRITVCSRLFTSNDNGEKPETFNYKLREYPELRREFRKLGLNKEVYAKVRGVPELYKLLRAGSRIRARRWLAARPDRAEENRKNAFAWFQAHKDDDNCMRRKRIHNWAFRQDVPGKSAWIREHLPWKLYRPMFYPEGALYHCEGCNFVRHYQNKTWYVVSVTADRPPGSAWHQPIHS